MNVGGYCMHILKDESFSRIFFSEDVSWWFVTGTYERTEMRSAGRTVVVRIFHTLSLFLGTGQYRLKSRVSSRPPVHSSRLRLWSRPAHTSSWSLCVRNVLLQRLLRSCGRPFWYSEFSWVMHLLYLDTSLFVTGGLSHTSASVLSPAPMWRVGNLN